LLPINECNIKHKFFDPFSDKLIFDAGKIKCLSLFELAAEKLRATTSRKVAAVRDFYDLWYMINNNFDFKKTLKNLNRTKAEIKEIKSRIKQELYEVLNTDVLNKFNLDDVLEYFNKIS